MMKEKEEYQRQELSIEQAQYVPHPKFDEEYALLLHENYHLLSEEDIPKLSEE
ncbi:transcriptional regulator SplA domain-containing protein [Bacillus swezeyi]|uniref:transcriptional regulator SplA domain-containing protein n=1 Tax=Bacillus swezeyi TaxID=1925020 RepID=UPI0027DDB5A9|nr:transcriptional regulator SplA domain-containing protein [Bacillus swezeyi]MED1739021.1 transcriptional regulator SplA domain-containing protein [Bacillus swezeyi]